MSSRALKKLQCDELQLAEDKDLSEEEEPSKNHLNPFDLVSGWKFNF